MKSKSNGDVSKSTVSDGAQSTSKHDSPITDFSQSQIASANKLGVDPKWVNTDGQIKWPPNRGFEGEPEKVTLEKGVTFDRYGGYYDNGEFVDHGKFVSPTGVPFEQRALPDSTIDKPYRKYEILKPISNADSGKAAPWFDKIGGGTQVDLPMTISELLEGGYIKVVE